MEERLLDMTGRPCPEPVVETQKALSDPQVESLRVKVDDPAAAENVSRLASRLGWAARTVPADGGGFFVQIARPSGPPAPSSSSAQRQPAPGEAPSLAVCFASARLGEGNEELGSVLMRSFVKTLKDLDPRPRWMLFLNGAIFLTTDGSALLDDLREFARGGTEILSCGTCLDYFFRKDQLQVGKVTNMFEIVSILARAGRVLSP